MSPLNTVILFSITLTWVSLASSKVIYSDDYGDLMEMRGDIYSDSEESEERTRSKRYPVHLDPNFGSIFRIRVGDCSRSADGHAKFFCPFPHPNGKHVCLEEWELCDGVKNCPDASDEAPSNCLFYNVMQFQLQSLAASQRIQDEERQKERSRWLMSQFH